MTGRYFGSPKCKCKNDKKGEAVGFPRKSDRFFYVVMFFLKPDSERKEHDEDMFTGYIGLSKAPIVTALCKCFVKRWSRGPKYSG